MPVAAADPLIDKDQIRIRRLHRAGEPAAIIHEGIFVFANQAFLDSVGVADFSTLQETPILDLIGEAEQERAKAFLASARFAREASEESQQAEFPLRTAKGASTRYTIDAHGIEFGGEHCEQLTLTPIAGADVRTRLAALPWKLYLSLGVLLLLLVLPGLLLQKLNINNTPRVYFPDDAPAVVADDRLRELFPNDEVILLLFEGVALFSDGFLNAYHDLGTAIETIDGVDKVYSATRQDHIVGSDEAFIVEPLIDVDTLDDTRPADRMERATSDRIAVNGLVAADGSALAMVVVPRGVTNSVARLQLQEAVLAAVDEARLRGYLTAVAGQVPVDIAEFQSMLRDNMIFNPVTVGLGLLLIWWLFRRLLAVVITGVSLSIVTSCTVAVYVLVDQPFTVISSIIPPLLAALTVAALVHFFNALHYMSQRGLVGRARIDRALREVRQPALYTALTTAAGLASLATSPIKPVGVFGLIAAVGVGLIFVVVYVLLPNVIARWDYAPWPNTRGGLKWMDRAVAVLYRTGMRHPVAVLSGLALLLVVGVPMIMAVESETNLQEFFADDHPIRVDTRHVEDKLSGTTSLEIVLRSAELDGLKSPESLSQIRQLQDWVESLDSVDRSISPVDFIEEMHWGFNAEQDEFLKIPDEAALISQYLLVYDGEDLYDFVDHDFQQSHVALSVNVHRANQISTLMEQIRDYLETRFTAPLNWELAGAGRLFADMEDLLVVGQVYSLLGAIGLIFVLMIAEWRSLRDALICMIPNLSPIFLIFTLMGMFGIWLDMATAMIASVAVGIAVDDTIHVYHGFIHRIRRGVGPVLALVRTYRQAGRAVMTTTMILSVQFFVLVVSHFVPTAHFGLLTATGLLAALLFDVLLLPALLILLFRKHRRAVYVDAVLSDR